MVTGSVISGFQALPESTADVSSPHLRPSPQLLHPCLHTHLLVLREADEVDAPSHGPAERPARREGGFLDLEE